MHCHSVFLRLLIYVSVWPPEEAKKVMVFFVYSYLVEHTFDVTGKGNELLSESD